jgi:hypothetical protein
MGKRARGGTRTAFQPLQTLGSPGNIAKPRQFGRSTSQNPLALTEFFNDSAMSYHFQLGARPVPVRNPPGDDEDDRECHFVPGMPPNLEYHLVPHPVDQRDGCLRFRTSPSTRPAKTPQIGTGFSVSFIATFRRPEPDR